MLYLLYERYKSEPVRRLYIPMLFYPFPNSLRVLSAKLWQSRIIPTKLAVFQSSDLSYDYVYSNNFILASCSDRMCQRWKLNRNAEFPLMHDWQDIQGKKKPGMVIANTGSIYTTISFPSQLQNNSHYHRHLRPVYVREM